MPVAVTNRHAIHHHPVKGRQVAVGNKAFREDASRGLFQRTRFRLRGGVQLTQPFIDRGDCDQGGHDIGVTGYNNSSTAGPVARLPLDSIRHRNPPRPFNQAWAPDPTASSIQ